ncbi:transposase [Mesorhizobium sp. AaZ16]|uniref:transposase n=1 Tax=Mesorhizobium sp. AaZ16 TaxID=3402289 RepID=UPI00374EC960
MARVRDSPPTSATRTPICSEPSARHAAKVLPWPLPHADTEAMQLHLDEITRHVAKGAHAVLLMDRAGWHTTANLDVPENITPIFLPSRSPELNPVENLWPYPRSNWLSKRVFETYDAIIDAACEAWQKLLAMPLSQKPARPQSQLASCFKPAIRAETNHSALCQGESSGGSACRDLLDRRVRSAIPELEGRIISRAAMLDGEDFGRFLPPGRRGIGGSSSAILVARRPRRWSVAALRQ